MLSHFKKLTYLFFAIYFFLPITTTAANDLSINLNPKSGTVQDIFKLQITIERKSQQEFGNPIFESSKEFSLRQNGTSNRHLIINGKQSSQVIFSFSVYPNPKLKPGKYKLPQGKIKINDHEIIIEEIQITIEKDISTSPQNKSGVDFVQIIEDLEPYVGQQVLYRAEILTTTPIVNAELSDLEFSGFWSESFGKAQETIRSIGNQNTKIISLRQALYPTQTGELTLPQRLLTAGVQTYLNTPQPRGSGSLLEEFWPELMDMDRMQIVEKRFIAPEIKLNVKPLPPAPNTNQKYIPVGNIELQSSIDKKNLKQGDSITLKIDLLGDANLRPLDLPEAIGLNKNDFKIYPEKPSVTTSTSGNRIIQKKSFVLALVPLKAGNLNVPSFIFLVFDPKLNDYKILKSSEHLLLVTPDQDANTFSSNIKIQSPKPIIEEPPVTEQITVAEDLSPQHIGPATLTQKFTFPTTWFWFILIFTPALTILLKVYLTKKSALSTELILQQNALKVALKSLNSLNNSSENFPDLLYRIITLFLRTKFLDRRESLTTKEAQELVETKTKNVDLGTKIKNILLTLEEIKFGSKFSPQTKTPQLNTILRDTKNILNEIEKYGK